MIRTTSSCRTRNLLAILPALAGAAVASTSLAQSGRQVMVMDDGAGAEMMHFTLPDMQALREPDYRRSDLPIFEEKLVLDGTQRVLVRELIEQYLEQFGALVLEKLGPNGAGGTDVQFAMGPDGEEGLMISLGGPGPEGGKVDRLMQDAIQGMRKAAGAEGEGEVGGEVAIMIGTTVDIEAGGGGGEAPPVPEGGVSATAGGGDGPTVAIGFSGPEGAELPEEVRKMLEARAQEIAEQIQKQMAERMAAGELGPGGLPPAERMEAQRQRLEELAKKAEELEDAKKRLARQFVGDVQAQLTEEQLPRWPALERKLTRVKTLPKGRLDGERTDLLAVLDDLKLSEGDMAAIAEAAEAYELTLHQALVNRNGLIPDAQKKIDEAIQQQRFDRALSLTDRAASARVAVRRVNDDYTEAIAHQLPEETAATFRAVVNETSFPRVYRATHGDRAFDMVRKLADLEEETLGIVDDLELAYRMDRDRLDDEIARVIRKEQPEQPKRDIGHLQAAMAGEPVALGARTGSGDDPIAEAFARRRDLDRKYIKLLEALLTPEQAELLPEVKERSGPVFIRSGG